jgi:DNA mismatch repair protein MSH2
VFEGISGVLSELDVLSSFADLTTSCAVPYVRPEVTASVRFNLYLLQMIFFRL